MKNEYWGPAKWGPALADEPLVETPVGEKCLHCDEVIVQGDSGLNRTHIESLKPLKARKAAIHKECVLREVFGSVAHQEGRCHCFGGTEDEEAGMSKRDAARAAVAHWEKTHGGGL